MGRLVKFSIYSILLGFIALVVYTYAGPFFGADFSAPETDVRQPVTLDAN